jgi:hypothetical protein
MAHTLFLRTQLVRFGMNSNVHPWLASTVCTSNGRKAESVRPACLATWPCTLIISNGGAQWLERGIISTKKRALLERRSQRWSLFAARSSCFGLLVLDITSSCMITWIGRLFPELAGVRFFLCTLSCLGKSGRSTWSSSCWFSLVNISMIRDSGMHGSMGVKVHFFVHLFTTFIVLRVDLFGPWRAALPWWFSGQPNSNI